MPFSGVHRLDLLPVSISSVVRNTWQLLTRDSFPETKGRTLEEIGALFGDKHIASRWYGMTEEEKEKIAHEAVAEQSEIGRDLENGAIKPDVIRQEKV